MYTDWRISLISDICKLSRSMRIFWRFVPKWKNTNKNKPESGRFRACFNMLIVNC